MDFCRLLKLFVRTLSKAYQGLIGLYPILEFFSPMSSQAYWAGIILHESLLGTKKKNKALLQFFEGFDPSLIQG